MKRRWTSGSAPGNGCHSTMAWTKPASRTAMQAKKRELIETGSSKRYARRDDRGRFTKDQVDVGRSSAADQRRSSGSTSSGQGDKGDRKK
jgi:hypothetical protein